MVTIINDSDQVINKKKLLNQLKQVIKEIDIRGNLTIKLGGTEESQRFNAQYRGKNYPTDVLSFFCGEDQPDGFYLGDILICMPVAVEQARENGMDLDTELFTLMVHGILHLAGYDHEEDDGVMMAEQKRLLDTLWTGS
jgi:probable rRNA maturation factor